MKRSILFAVLVAVAASCALVSGCTGDKCSSDDIDCIADHLVLVRPVDDGARIELVKVQATTLTNLIPPPPCSGTMCSGRCVSTDVDPANCGMCDHPCKQGQACVKGMCACPAGQTACNGACVDTQIDGLNCGMCDHICGGVITGSSSASSGTGGGGGAGGAGGSTSSNSASSSSASSSASGSTSTSSASSSSSSSASGSSSSSSSSGGMGGAGGAGGATSSGSSSGTGGAGGSGDEGFFCRGGMCVSTCTAPLTPCGRSCVDTMVDAINCGSCGHGCGFGETCKDGLCKCTAAPYTCGCVDPSVDELNCGACGVACGPGQTCEQGVCWPPPPDANNPLAITNAPAPAAFTDPSKLQPLEIDWKDPNACQPAFCGQLCNDKDEKCSTSFFCTKSDQGAATGSFKSFFGFLAAPRSESSLFSIQMVPLSATGCSTGLADRLATGDTQGVTVGAGARIPVKLTSSSDAADSCTQPAALCNCSIRACSTPDGDCSYEVKGLRIGCGDNCNCASALVKATTICCPNP
jgi:Stigma-specific protein, Stig1